MSSIHDISFTSAFLKEIENADDFLLDLPSLTNGLLNPEDSPDINPALYGPYSRQHRYRQRQKSERNTLRQQVEILESKLKALNEGKAPREPSQWETMAQSLRASAHEATLENKRLKRALEEQIRIANSLQQILAKRPQLKSFNNMDITTDRLLRTMPRDLDARESMFHTILDATYAQVENTLATKGLSNAPDGYHAIDLDTTSSPDCIGIDVKIVGISDKSYVESAERFWSIFCNPNDKLDMPNANINILNRFGDDGVYFSDICAFGQDKPYMLMLSGMKRYVEKNRIVIVIKTFLDDALHPPPSGLLVGDHTALFVVEKMSDGKCRRRHCLLRLIPIKDVKEIEGNPLSNQPTLQVCDYVRKHSTYTSHAIEYLMNFQSVLNNTMAQREAEALLEARDPREKAEQYIKANKINEVLQELCSLMMYSRPANPREFMIQQLQIIRHARETRSVSSFFTELDLTTMFSMFDTTNQGSISLAQYDQALKNLGIDRPTIRLPESITRVDKNLFVRSM
ncbi:sporangia induced hypothetical protein [Thraustotheca clavata]|uniref:EF-hand domain-containing protein n=1 Tax=Thraustotheca clavata TaxID=74557 RepID=A0A1V9ZHC5_9STRA|nr:sporangia induced hypothetical protein [Thraustotheca clavata]